MTHRILSWLFVIAITFTASLAADEIADSKQVDFAREILPILSDKCFVCHGPDGQAKDDLRLDSFAAASHDIDGRRAIHPESPEKSEILVRIHSPDEPMPPKDAERQLTENERGLLGRWIRQGGQYAMHWAFVAPIKKNPTIGGKVKKSDTIDAFIQVNLTKNGKDFAPPADKSTLARRVAIILTGLPPEPELLERFLKDERKDAYERLVDELLQSPRYGEHQARYWLDAVRYGDTHGLHLDNRRGIFPYRDWVIDALNRNLPLDQFITWQLAGDLLPNPTLEQQVATGYVRMNPTTAEGGAIPAEFQAKNNFDRVETLGTVFLGMSLTCARCHTHKYDPIPQTEYYRLLAFFNSTAEHSMDGNKYDYAPVIKAPASVNAWTEWNANVADRDKILAAARNILKSGESSDADIKNWDAISPQARLAMVADAKGKFAAQAIHKQSIELAVRFAAAEKAFTTTLVAKDLPSPRQTKLLARGEYNLPTGEPLEPGVLSVMSPFPDGAPRNRLGLAKWLTAREHPLVARVLVNRVWQRTFGHGLVRTPEDFGLQGQQATHPELLDWLAVELHDGGWNLKNMLRLMVTSRTFRQSSAWRKGIEDPDNKLFARGPSHRLDAEVIRDLALWSSGLLDPFMGGEGVKPYQPKGLWSALMHPASNTKNYVQDTGAKIYRRSLYVYWKRTSPHPMMMLFDAPNRESSCVRRSRTNTSLQSLGLLNEQQRIEMSRMLAQRLLRERGTDTERLDMLYNLLTSRKPTTGERATCMKLLSDLRERYSAAEKDAIALLSTGNAPRDEKLNPTEHAAWTQLAITVLASDAALLLY